MKFLLNLTFIIVIIELMKVERSYGAQKALYHIDNLRNVSHDSDAIDHIHLDDGKVLKRDKRFLLFSGAGVAKLILGFAMPVETRDRVNWRTLNMAYNFQSQYMVLPNATYIWNHWARSLVDQKQKFDVSGFLPKDSTRELIYNFLELAMNRKNKAGHECVLKTICETAAHPIERYSIFDEIFHLVFSPHKNDVSDEYTMALKAGTFGTDCDTIYPKCKKGDGILDHISKLY